MKKRGKKKKKRFGRKEDKRKRKVPIFNKQWKNKSIIKRGEKEANNATIFLLSS